MDQLIVLQEIYESFSKGCDGLGSIDPKSIDGNCSGEVAKLLEGCKQGKIDIDLCSSLVDCVQDVYEAKRLGDICKKAGLLEMAIRSYEKAISLTGDKSMNAVLLNNLGQVYAQYGDLGRAVAYYKKAVKRFEFIGDFSGQAHVQGNLGSAYRRAREWEKAIEYCYNSLRAFEDLEDELGAAQMTGSLGRVYAEMGEAELAVRYFERSLRAFQKMGDRRSEAWVLNRLGRIYADHGLEDSVNYYNQSLSIFEELGQGQGSGIVLSNLGKVYLDRAEASLARDCLERSLTLLRKETKPAYYNASAWLGATYSVLAKKNQSEASAASSVIEGARIASRYYSRAADRYRDLVITSGIELPCIGMAAGVAALLSILAQLQVEDKYGEAVKMVDRAVSNLEEMALYASKELEQIEYIKRTLIGMKEVWSLDLICRDPWKLAKLVAKSIEYLMGGAFLPGEVGVCIYDALKSLKCAIEEEQQRRDPSEMLKASASRLREAEMIIQSDQTGTGFDSATRLGNAATLIERLISVETDSVKTGSSHIKELLSSGIHRKALLQIGWVLVIDALPAVDKAGYIYSWDESMNLVENRPAGQFRSLVEQASDGQEAISKAQPMQTIRLDDALQKDEAFYEVEDEFVFACTSEPEEIDEKNTILEMDAERAPFAGGPVVKIIPERGSLVPITSQLVYSPHDTWAMERPKEEHRRVNRAEHSKTIFEAIRPEGRDSRLIEEFDHSSSIPRTQISALEEPIKVEADWDSSSSSASPPIGNAERQYVFGNMVITRYNMIKLVKALTVIVLALLSIDVILYLI